MNPALDAAPYILANASSHGNSTPELSPWAGLHQLQTTSCSPSSAVRGAKQEAGAFSDVYHGRCHPAHGAASDAGRRRSQEDRSTSHLDLCHIPLSSSSGQGCDKLPEDYGMYQGSFNMISSAFGMGGTNFRNADGSQPLHFFAVYDGHAGHAVSEYCAQWLHEHLRAAIAQELAQRNLSLSGLSRSHSQHMLRASSGFSTGSLDSHLSASGSPSISFPSSLGSSPAKSSELATASSSFSLGAPGSAAKRTTTRSLPLYSDHGLICAHDVVENALLRAFLTIDADLRHCGHDVSLTGSTANVAVVGHSHIWVANCGGWLGAAFVHGLHTGMLTMPACHARLMAAQWLQQYTVPWT